MSMQKFLITLLLLPITSYAQPGRTILMSPHIKTLQLKVDSDDEKMPVIKLNSSEQLQISFDDLTHEYRRYTYKIQHCDFEGNPSTDLFESDYVNAVSDSEVIDQYEPSQNTTVLYTHYSFSLPNAQMRPLLSGNYLLTISTEDEEGNEVPVVKTYFGVVDQKVVIRPECTTNTDVNWNSKHQQLSMQVDASALTLRDAAKEIKTLVMQNRRFDNAAFNPSPTAVNGNTIIWEHTKQLLFKAGNEYRKMEIVSTRYPGMHGDNIRWFDPYYHYTLLQDTPRKNYLYDEDQNGLYLTRCAEGSNADTEADYVIAHFSLSMLPDMDKNFYVNGRWSYDNFSSEYKMTYNHDSEAYEADILLKLGYYNYQYLYTTHTEPHIGHTQYTEGNFYQTENEYEILVYHCPTGGRYWQLVGVVTPIYKE